MVYIVECYFGQYDTAYQFIDSIFDDASAAEKRKKIIETYYRKLLDTPCPVDEDFPYEKLSQKDLIKLYDWQDGINEAEDFVFAKVTSFELNKAKPLF